MVVEDDVLDADAAAGFLRLGAAPRRERAATLGLVPGVAVGDRDEPHAMAERGVLRRRAARALIAVVGMRAERDDVQLAVRARRLRALGRLLVDRPGRNAGRAGQMERSPQDDRVRRESLHDTSV